jgi:hypothetical protein
MAAAGQGQLFRDTGRISQVDLFGQRHDHRAPHQWRCPPIYGPPGELRLKSARERMDIISAHREVGTYRGAAVACGTESRCQSWSFPSPRSRSPVELTYRVQR